MSGGAERLQMCINGVWPRPKPPTVPQPAKARILYSQVREQLQPILANLHRIVCTRLYKDSSCHGCLCIIYQYHHLCCCLGSVSPLVSKPNWNWKGLVWSAKGNEMTFYWSHPEQSQMFGCKGMNGNTERHNHVQYVESSELAVMYQATPSTESHHL